MNVQDFQKMKDDGRKISMITCYGYSAARACSGVEYRLHPCRRLRGHDDARIPDHLLSNDCNDVVTFTGSAELIVSSNRMIADISHASLH